MKRLLRNLACFIVGRAPTRRLNWSALAVMLLGGGAGPVPAAITPFFSVQPAVLPASQPSWVLLTVRTTGTGTLTPSGDQFTFTFDSVGSQIQAVNPDASVILHVGSGSTLAPADFQVSLPAANQVRITYTSFSSKIFAAGETISLHVTLLPQIATVFAANVGYASALQTAAPATGDTLSFVDFPSGPQGPPGPPGPPGGSVVHFSWNSVTGQVYQLQFKTNLLATNWNNAGSLISATNVTTSTTDPIGPEPQRFYRLKQP